MNLKEILAEARQLAADGASKREVSRFVWDATEGRTADVERLQEAVDSGDDSELPPSFRSFREVGEGIAAFARSAGKVAGKAGQLAKDAAGNPLVAAGGLLALGQRGAQAVGRLGVTTAAKVADDPLGAAKSTADFLSSENPLDILGPETAATALIGPIARARKAAKLTEKAKKAPSAAKAVDTPTPVAAPIQRPASAIPSGLDLTDNARAISESHAQFGGSTIDPRTGHNFGGDDVWAVQPKQPDGSPHGKLFDEAPTPFDVRDYIRANKELLEGDDTLMIGTWFDEANEAHGKHELAVTKIFPGDQQSAAQRFALDNDQFGYVNLADPEFQTVGAADEAANAFKRAELDALIPERTARRLEKFLSLMNPEQTHNFEFTKTGRRRSQRVKDDALRVFSLMPETEQGVQMAMLGSEMAHWYRSSARTLRSAFGEDAPRFSALLASTSPNIGVQDNLGASFQIWRDWQRAGRPTDVESVDKMIRAASKKWGITPTAFDNTHKILGLSNEQLLDPKLLRVGGMLSGPKVDPFYANLMGESQRLVVDTHMKGGFGFGSDKVRVPEGLGAEPAMRDVAQAFQELTGSPVDVADIQAAQWAGIRAIRELQGGGPARKGADLAEDVVLEEHFGGLFGVEQGFSGKARLPEVRAKIREQPSFDNLFRDEQYKTLLSDLNIDIPPATVEVGLQGIDPANARFADILAFAQRMDLRDQKKFLYGAAAAVLLGNAEDADAQGLAEEMLIAAGLSPETISTLPPQALGAYAGLLSERPEVTPEELAQFQQNLGLQQGADMVARDLARDTARVQPKTMLERADSIINSPDRNPSIPGRFLEGALDGWPINMFLNLLAPRLEEDQERTNTAVSNTHPGLLTRGELGR